MEEIHLLYDQRFRLYVSVIIASCFFPLVIIFSGVDLNLSLNSADITSLKSVQLSSLFLTLKGAFVHTILEWAAFCIGFLTAILALSHYYVNKNTTIFIIAVALFFASCTDVFHILAADRIISSVSLNQNFIPFTWACSRIFHSLILLAGALIILRVKNALLIDFRFLVMIVTIFGYFALSLVYFCLYSSYLPKTQYDVPILGFLTRPFDVFPLLVYLCLAFYIYPKLYQKSRDIFVYTLMLGVIFDIATQLYMAFGSSQIFDAAFNIAHFFKVCAYGMPLMGLIVSYMNTFNEITIGSEKLQKEIFQRKEAEKHINQLNYSLKEEVERQTQQLKEKNSILEKVLEVAPIGIMVIESNGHVIQNPASVRIVGMPLEDKKPQEWQESFGIFYPDQTTPYPLEEMPLMLSFRRGKSLDDVKMFIRNSKIPDGCFILAHSRPLVDDQGTIFGALAMFQDITERIKMEEHLLQSKDLLESEVKERTQELHYTNELLNQHLLVREGQLEFLEKTRSIQSLNRLSQNALEYIALFVGAEVGVLYLAKEKTLNFEAGYACPEDLDRTPFGFGQGFAGQVAMQQSIQSIKKVSKIKLSLKTAFGEIKLKELVGLPLIQNNQVIGVIELAFKEPIHQKQLDFLKIIAPALAVSLNLIQNQNNIKLLLQETQAQSEELQYNQQELEQTNRHLEEQRTVLEEQHEQFRQLNIVLQTSQSELEIKTQKLIQESQFKSDFLANMSHELRTPLNSILILSKLMAKNKNSNLTQKQIKNLNTIYSSGTDLLTLINDILDMAKIESGHIELNLETIKISELRDKLQDVFEVQIHNKGLAFDVRIDPDCPETIISDAFKIEQILKNLLSNALKFTHSGSLKLDFKSDYDGGVSVMVKDTGFGISQENLKTIFEAFKQVDNSGSRQFGGTGLGLFIAQQMAVKLGGSIQVESQEGEGSCFSLHLPLNLEFETEKVHPQNVDKSLNVDHISTIQPNQELLVLIIEDDINFANLLLEQCIDAGFKGMVATDGKEGLQLAKELNPSVILLDNILPDMTGLELLDQIKGSPLKDIPVYIMSVDDKAHQAIERGAISFWHKNKSESNIEELVAFLCHLPSDKKTILLVEDQTSQIQLLQETFAHLEVEIVFVNTIEASLEVLKQRVIDCIILDLNLKSESGFELLEKLTENNNLPHPPIIVHTARELSQEEKDSLELLAESVIIKGHSSSERLLSEVSLFLYKLGHDMDTIAVSEKKIVQYDSRFEGKCILLVDDDMRNIYAMKGVLAEQGCNVFVAKNGKEALSTLDSLEKVDLILMDIMMPVMDGLEATRNIRKMNKYKNIPIISLTAKAMAGDREKSLEAGASDYLTKPINIDHLFNLLNLWIKSE